MEKIKKRYYQVENIRQRVMKEKRKVKMDETSGRRKESETKKIC